MFPPSRMIASRAELLAAGFSPRALTAHARSGALLRVRRDHYAAPGTPPNVIAAVRVGGRLACLSALELAGVFVFENRRLHVHLKANASRQRSPTRPGRLTAAERMTTRRHWERLTDAHPHSDIAVGVVDALGQSLHCQAAELSIATVDNALHLGLIDSGDLDAIFVGAPRSVARLRGLIDGRSESGQETMIRLLLIRAGLRFELQVEISGIGRVDFVIEGILVVEADSRLAHEGWQKQRRDRRRDLLLAAEGLMSLRPAYEHTMFEPELVLASILALLATRGVSPARARAAVGFSLSHIAEVGGGQTLGRNPMRS